jgi:hypothetical protein
LLASVIEVDAVMLVPAALKNLGVIVTEDGFGLNKAIPVSNVIVWLSVETCESMGRVKLGKAGES